MNSIKSASKTITVIQGEFRISDSPTVVLSTILGSCIAVCLYDRVAKIGGMNHFLLPGQHSSSNLDVRYGVNAMELLINGLLKSGADRKHLTAKLFGGSSIAKNLGKIGESNITFAREYLRNEKIPCVSESLGGGFCSPYSFPSFVRRSATVARRE